MIPIKELRVGNTIFSNTGGEIINVESAEFEMIEDDFGGYEGIPITEQWLLKFGFIYEKEHELFKGLTLNVNDSIQFYSDNQDNYDHCTLFLGFRDTEYDFINQKRCKYVHDFQNLYFALTGEELVISDSVS